MDFIMEFINYAHRGASAYAPENTLAAFYMLLTQRIQFPDQYPAERQQVRRLEACAALLRPFAE